MKDYSNRIFAPAAEGSQRRTHWYYERVRGEYLNNQAYLSAFDKRKFILENPKHQLIDKTLLSKAENSWNQRPDIVSKGAQDSFKRFADNITEILENDNLAITESYFKDAIARIIMFRTIERLITKSTWYDGGFRAQTVTYSMAYLSFILKEMGFNLNFNNIWENQAIPASLFKMLDTIAEKVYFKITAPPAGFANISQWTKNVKCWENVKEIKIEFNNLDESLFVDNQEIKYIQKEEKKKKVVDTGIEIQIKVINTPIVAWKTLNSYYVAGKSELKLSSMHADILFKMSTGKIGLPSEKQSAILYNLKKVAEGEGLNLT